VLSEGYRLRPGLIVTCAMCQRRWRVPDGMHVKLSEAAWVMLVEHRQSHDKPTRRRLDPRVRVSPPDAKMVRTYVAQAGQTVEVLQSELLADRLESGPSNARSHFQIQSIRC
jgi:hypothetical protein